MKLRYKRTARSDIARILDYIGEQSPQARQTVETRLRAVLEILPEFPFAGGVTTRPAVRRLVVTPYPYAVFYRVSDNAIIVLSIRHTARRPSPAVAR